MGSRREYAGEFEAREEKQCEKCVGGGLGGAGEEEWGEGFTEGNKKDKGPLNCYQLQPGAESLRLESVAR